AATSARAIPTTTGTAATGVGGSPWSLGSKVRGAIGVMGRLSHNLDFTSKTSDAIRGPVTWGLSSGHGGSKMERRLQASFVLQAVALAVWSDYTGQLANAQPAEAGRLAYARDQELTQLVGVALERSSEAFHLAPVARNIQKQHDLSAARPVTMAAIADWLVLLTNEDWLGRQPIRRRQRDDDSDSDLEDSRLRWRRR
ncbi:hypothetical protein BGZ46_003970, partial [Entomortierella lignicola]